MNIKKRIVQNTAIQIIITVINLLAGVFLLSLVARYLGKTTLGKYSFISSFYSFFITFLDLGVSTILLREVSQNREEAGKLLSNLVTYKLFLSLLLSLLAVAVAIIYPFPNDLRMAICLYSPILIILAFSSFQIIFQADLRLGYIALASLFWRISSVLFILLSIWLNLGLAAIVFSFVLAELVKSAALYLFSGKFVKIKIPTLEINLWIRVLKASFPLAIGSIFGAVIRNIDVMMITRMRGFAEVGLYTVAYRIFDMSLTLPIALIVSVFPLMSKFYKEDLSMLQKIHQKTFDILSVCGILLAALVVVLADKIIILIFGPTYINSSFALRMLIFSSLFVYISIGTGTLLIAAGKQIIQMWLVILSAILSIILNYILIRHFGLNGAAITNVIVTLLLIILTFYFVAFKLKISLSITKFIKAVLCGICTAVILLYLRQFPLFVSIPAGVLFYASLIFMCKAADMKDLSSLLKFKL